MKNKSRQRLRLWVLVPLLAASGCTYTTVGTKLSPIAPPRPVVQPAIEHTVGDFSFTLEGGKMVTSNFVGHVLNDSIMSAWKDHGYIREARYVESSAFSGQADYNLTLSGSQYGESSIGMQILSGLTLTLLPYSVTQHYDLHYTLQDTKSGKQYSASVQESNETYVELFLLFALPFGQRGQAETVARMGDHLYDQLRQQGAFQAAPAASP
ncbi:MAG TPA: hypothetical protein VMW17_22970 [Candidatus Binatia bacterium]|nr:hypothetical protein [Candidatus Binatia bacterium]